MIQKRYRLKLNSLPKIEELLQELYNETDKTMVTIQEQMNKLSNSVDLNSEILDAKSKYAKAMNDFITNKDKVVGRKLEIAKLMTEIHKFDGNIGNMMSQSEDNFDWDSIKDTLVAKDKEQTEEYNIKIK